jgi:PleD family two-component response regulator
LCGYQNYCCFRSVGVFSEGLGKGATFWFKVSLPELSYTEAGLSRPLPKASSGSLAARIAESAKHNNDVKRPRATGCDPALVARVSMAARQKVKILVAEDSSTNRRVARMMLKMLGFIAVYAEDGLLAVEAAEREKFDVILMDLHMPGLDGKITRV